jgi:endoglucanase
MTLVLAFIPAATANPGAASAWARPGITEAIGKGFVPADIQGSYTDTISRAEFCRMAVKWVEIATGKDIDALLTEKGVSRNPNAFTDTNDPDILAAAALGITDGTGNNLFNPNGGFDRQQAATMIRNVCGIIGANTANPPNAGFADINDAGAWARSAINFVGANGIMSGTGGGSFSPLEPYTREQSIVTFNNINPGNFQEPDEPEPSGSISAAELVADIRAGWNLGNTFDAHSNRFEADRPVDQMERSWVHHITTKANIDAVAKAGFNTIRIPVTWFKVADANNNYTIRADWMARVREVVDYAVANELYIILNTHHDSNIFKLLDDDMAESEKALERIWAQIAETFREYDEKLVFEGLNEPRTYGSAAEWNGGTPEERKNLNTLNQLFVDTVRKTGGNNTRRILMVPTYAAGAAPNALRDFQVPSDPANTVNKIILSVHTYSPFRWAHDGIGSYGSDGLSAIRRDLDRIQARADALGIPVILGEWGSIAAGELSERVQHAEDYVREARARGMATVWWDNGGTSTAERGHGFALLNRRENAWAFPEIVAAMLRGAE